MKHRAILAGLLTAAALAVSATPAMAAGVGPSMCKDVSPGYVFIAPTAFYHENGKYNNPGEFGQPFVPGFQSPDPIACNPQATPTP